MRPWRRLWLLVSVSFTNPAALPSLSLVEAAAAKSLQSCPTLCDPIDGSPPGSPVPGVLQAGTLEWVAISFSNAWKWKVNMKLLSRVQLLATPWTAAYQAPPSMGFSRQESWSGVPLPSPAGRRSRFKSHWHLWTPALCKAWVSQFFQSAFELPFTAPFYRWETEPVVSFTLFIQEIILSIIVETKTFRSDPLVSESLSSFLLSFTFFLSFICHFLYFLHYVIAVKFSLLLCP